MLKRRYRPIIVDLKDDKFCKFIKANCRANNHQKWPRKWRAKPLKKKSTLPRRKSDEKVLRRTVKTVGKQAFARAAETTQPRENSARVWQIQPLCNVLQSGTKRAVKKIKRVRVKNGHRCREEGSSD